jgi:hypothetical protein
VSVHGWLQSIGPGAQTLGEDTAMQPLNWN